MIRVTFTERQAIAVLDVFDGRECGPDTVCDDIGLDEDSLDAMCRELRTDRAVKLTVPVAEGVMEELLHYAELRSDPVLRAAARAIAVAVGASKGLILPPKPKRKPAPAPVLEPTIKRRDWALRAPEGVNGYCGPVAIAALTGTTTDRVAALIRGYRKEAGQTRPAVRGIYPREMIRAFADLGYEAHCIAAYARRRDRPTLAKFHKEVLGSRQDQPRVIVTVTEHYVAVHGDSALCSLQPQRQQTFVAFSASARRKVINAFEIRPRTTSPATHLPL